MRVASRSSRMSWFPASLMGLGPSFLTFSMKSVTMEAKSLSSDADTQSRRSLPGPNFVLSNKRRVHSILISAK